MKYSKRNTCIVIGALMCSPLGYAHVEKSNNFKTYVDASASLTYRSDSSVEDGQPWLIPGAMMGGEALAYEKGFTLDDAQVTGGFNYQDLYQVSAKISAHAHNDEWNVELEHIWFGFDTSQWLKGSLIEVGKMTTATTPTAYWHASQSDFTEASLLTDVFFGRHFNDIGARASAELSAVEFGVELWNGSSWPATPSEGTGAVFVRANPTFGAFTLRAGTWLMLSKAEQRNDDRYVDHSHGGVAVVSPTSDVFYTGDVATFGLNVGGSYDFSVVTLKADFEWIQQQGEGEINDANSAAALENTYDGFRTFVGLYRGNHAFIAQYEMLAFENDFKTQASPSLIASSNLTNQSHEPTKLAVAWHWQFMTGLTFRAQYTFDQTQEAQDNNRFALGMVWNGRFLP